MSEKRILYCHCAYAQVITEAVKNEVLDRLATSDVSFEAVADLCELSARKDPALKRLADGTGELRIAACYPRAVRWLFSAAGAPLPVTGVSVRNMRTEAPADIVTALLSEEPLVSSDSDSDSDSESASSAKSVDDNPESLEAAS